jgi:prepilin-type N-terminal cleavage/methylation domain-containing protein/prepilin-type processing-associated H-X9-DG protein
VKTLVAMSNRAFATRDFPTSAFVSDRGGRQGVTLIEMLLVIAIIGALIGLLMPAVQKARGAALRVVCANNLGQIGLALHQYHDSEGVLPPGFSSRGSAQPFPRMTWLTRLLPYIEQPQLWHATVGAYDDNPVSYQNPPHIGLATPVKVYQCPMDPRVSRAQITHFNWSVALTSYVGVLGTSFDRIDGVLYLDSRVRLADITDGTSNTLMVGERPPSADKWFGWWYTGLGQFATGSDDMLLGVRERNARTSPFTLACPSGPYDFRTGQMNQQCDLFHFWSLHDGGATFAFCDASVHFLPYSANPIMPALATRSGGEAVSWTD